MKPSYLSKALLRFCAVSLTWSLSQVSELLRSWSSGSSNRVGVLGLEAVTQAEFILSMVPRVGGVGQRVLLQLWSRDRTSDFTCQRMVEPVESEASMFVSLSQNWAQLKTSFSLKRWRKQKQGCEEYSVTGLSCQCKKYRSSPKRPKPTRLFWSIIVAQSCSWLQIVKCT